MRLVNTKLNEPYTTCLQVWK